MDRAHTPFLAANVEADAQPLFLGNPFCVSGDREESNPLYANLPVPWMGPASQAPVRITSLRDQVSAVRLIKYFAYFFSDIFLLQYKVARQSARESCALLSPQS